MHEYEFKHLEATRPVVSIRKATQTYVHCEKRGICVRGIHTNLMSTGKVYVWQISTTCVATCQTRTHCPPLPGGGARDIKEGYIENLY